MKKYLIGLLGFAFVAGMSGLASAVITGSSHDFSDNTAAGAKDAWNSKRQEICRVCHVPHDHGRTLYSSGLLWNHDVSTQSYTMYSSTTLQGATAASPDGYSKLCLGCHDGTVGVDSFDGKHTTPGDNVIGLYDPGYQIPGAAASYSLQGTHPISITYNTADTGLNATTTVMGTSGTIADVLQEGKVQCSSCHDVHNSSEVAAGTHLLRENQKKSTGTASGLCLTCHNK